MKRDIIIIEDKAVSVTGNEVWMTAGEIAGLFHTGVPAVNAAIKAILKADVLSDYEVSKAELDDAQRQAVAGLMMMLDWEDDDDDDCDPVEEDWFGRFPDDRNAGRRIAVLEPLMKRDDISDDCKKVLWFANFLFIYYFCLYG